MPDNNKFKWSKSGMTKKSVLWLLAIIFLVGAVIIFLMKGTSGDDVMEMNADMTKDTEIKKEIPTVNPVERKNANSLMLVGKIVSNESAMIYPRREGIVKDIYVDIGDTVQAGEVIGTLFPRGVEGQADAIIFEAQTKRDLADTTLDAREDLGDAARDAADERDISNEEEELVDEQQDLLEETALDSLIATEATLSKEIIVQGHTKLISPFTGKVAKRFITVGESITPSEPVFSLVDVPTHLAQKAESEIRFSVPEEYIGALEVGDDVVFFIGSGEDKPRSAEITRISPQIDEMTHQYAVQAVISDDLNLPHNAQVRVRLVTSDVRVYSVPSSSVKRIDDENYIWILNQGVEIPKKMRVRVLGDDGEFAEVTGNIDQETVVVKRVTQKIMADTEMMQVDEWDEMKAEVESMQMDGKGDDPDAMMEDNAQEK